MDMEAEIMRKLPFILLILFILTGCSSAEYEQNLNEGMDAFQDGNYSEALNKFELAQTQVETKEVRDLMTIVNNLISAKEMMIKGEVEESNILASETVAYGASELEYSMLKKIFDQARSIVEETDEILAKKKFLEEELLKSEVLADAYEYEEAILILNQALDGLVVNNVVIEELIKDIEENQEKFNEENYLHYLAIDASEKEVEIKYEEEIIEVAEEVVQTESKENLTVYEAMEKLRVYLNIQSKTNYEIDHEGKDEQGKYIFQIYQIVADDDYGSSHSLDVGRYKINPEDGEIERAFWLPEDFEITGEWESFSSDAYFKFQKDGYVQITGVADLSSGFYTIDEKYIRLTIAETGEQKIFTYEYLEFDLRLMEAETGIDLFLSRMF